MKTLVKILRCFAPDAGNPFYASGAAVAISLLFASLPAGAVNFRQLPHLPTIPPSITFPAEREVLRTDLDRLAERRKALQFNRVLYNRECAHRVPFNHSLRRHCSLQLQALRRESSWLRTDITALRQRFLTVEGNAHRQRGSGPRNSMPAVNASTPGRRDMRLKVIGQALSGNAGGWGAVLAHLKSETGKGAGNPALRDAYAYLDGMYEVQVAADHPENAYYKHGVRRWLARDYWTAALSFARAARDNPYDRRVFASFADAAGRQHASPVYRKARRCVSGNISDWAKRFGKPHTLAVKKMLAGMRKAAPGEDVVSLRNMLGAIVVFAEQSDPGVIGGESTGRIATAALSRAQDHDHIAALTGYIDLSRRLAGERETGKPNLFFERYANAVGDRTGRMFLSETGKLSMGVAVDEEYLKRLRRALAEGDGDPFSETLTRAQVIRLQR